LKILKKIFKINIYLAEKLFSSLVEVTERALCLFDSKEVLLVGGVGCNERLQEMMEIMTKERGATVCKMDERYCVDNGAMIAYTASLDPKKYEIADCTITQRFRTDAVDIFYK